MSASLAPTPPAHFAASIAHHSKSFSLARKLLPEPASSAAAVVYAWCRRCDDAIDLSAPEAQQRALFALEEELRAVYAGAVLDDPVLHAFQEVVNRFGIPEDYPRELLAGMRMDVDAVRYASLAELLLYCHRVAGTVGLMMCHVMGVGRQSALRHAAHLGIAMQLTNICRDVAEDWRMGRMYLPADALAREGGGVLVLAAGTELPKSVARSSARVVKELLAEADRYYASADAGLPALSWRSALAVRAARMIYAAIGRRIAARRFDVLAPRAHTSLATKLFLIVGAVVATLGEWRDRLRAPVRPETPQTIVRFPGDVLPV
jgi:phytoene synthase